MSRGKGPKNYRGRENLITLMEREKIESFEEMSRQIKKRTGITVAPQNLRGNAKSGDDFQNLTIERAETIVKAYPKYRAAWLLGLDDDMTHADALARYITNKNTEHTRMQTLFALMADMSGWSVSPSSVVGGAEYDPENEEMNKTNFFSWQFENYAILSDGETTVTLNETAFVAFVQKTLDYFTFELLHTSDDAKE